LTDGTQAVKDLAQMNVSNTSSVVWSGSIDNDEEGRTSSANFQKENI
jgi:hypothetical protein